MIILRNFTILEKKLLIFLRDYIEVLSDASYKAKQNSAGLKMLTPEQMFQRLPIGLAQANEIREIVYSLYQSKQINKKVCNNIIKSI